MTWPYYHQVILVGNPSQIGRKRPEKSQEAIQKGAQKRTSSATVRQNKKRCKHRQKKTKPLKTRLNASEQHQRTEKCAGRRQNNQRRPAHGSEKFNIQKIRRHVAVPRKAAAFRCTIRRTSATPRAHRQDRGQLKPSNVKSKSNTAATQKQPKKK